MAPIDLACYISSIAASQNTRPSPWGSNGSAWEQHYTRGADRWWELDAALPRIVREGLVQGFVCSLVFSVDGKVLLSQLNELADGNAKAWCIPQAEGLASEGVREIAVRALQESTEIVRYVSQLSLLSWEVMKERPGFIFCNFALNWSQQTWGSVPRMIIPSHVSRAAYFDPHRLPEGNILHQKEISAAFP